MPAERARLRYVLRRCWYEGVSKRQLTRAVGGGAGLSAERGYLLTVLPAAFLRHLCAPLRREPGGVARALVLTLGTLATALGYAAGRR
ncbi:hypothetical protein [Nocardioides alcanivorans]|uniref:hypothetical protein n=1 Tax=Nocardioides alcanivorans TaxID=2897352 RepID=UPI001F2519E8|nr:hypothetical protein [Nocardioides alcanivorans]